MRLLLLLLLTVLAAAARACPPPFNNFRFAGNDTAALIQEAMLENGLGWTEAASHFQNPIQPWPRDSDGIVRIKYCFATPDDRQNFKILIDQAWNVWKTGIKNPGHSRGHRLIFQEFNWNPAVEWKYCYKDLAGGSTPANWNHGANLPTETIVIIGEDVGVFAQSTLGYTLPALNNAAGRHKVNIHPSAGGSGFSVPLLAHELGHVWGLLHEHQRSDRDHYVHFECSNLVGYNQARQLVEQQGQHTMDEVCTSETLGWKYNFAGPPNFSKESRKSTYHGQDYVWHVAEGPFYDVASIMHYASGHGFDASRQEGNVQNHPLTMWKGRWPGFQPPGQVTQDNSEIINLNYRVSNLDVFAVKHLYPW